MARALANRVLLVLREILWTSAHEKPPADEPEMDHVYTQHRAGSGEWWRLCDCPVR